MNMTGCFHCGQEGHFIRNCPQLVAVETSEVGTVASTPGTSGHSQAGRGGSGRGVSIAPGRGHGRVAGRGGKIGSARWASPVRPKLGPSWAIKLLALKKSSQIWPGPVWPSLVWPGPARPARIFFCLEKTIWPDQPGF